MSADVVILPTLRRFDAEGGETETLQIRPPARVYARLKKLAGAWALTPNEAAESILVDAINKAAGVK